MAWPSDTERLLGCQSRIILVQCWGAESLAYDLITGRGVVSSRAASILRSADTHPSIGRFVYSLKRRTLSKSLWWGEKKQCLKRRTPSKSLWWGEKKQCLKRRTLSKSLWWLRLRLRLRLRPIIKVRWNLHEMKLEVCWRNLWVEKNLGGKCVKVAELCVYASLLFALIVFCDEICDVACLWIQQLLNRFSKFFLCWIKAMHCAVIRLFDHASLLTKFVGDYCFGNL